jgi:hypothetical protein
VYNPVHYYSYFFNAVNCFPDIFLKILATMAYNVPAVYDVFASPIKETVGFQDLQKCAGMSRGKERSD